MEIISKCLSEREANKREMGQMNALDFGIRRDKNTENKNDWRLESGSIPMLTASLHKHQFKMITCRREENGIIQRNNGGMAGQHYCLRWNNYQSNMTSVFHQLLQTEAFVDVTLACNEASLKAHKVVLSACSSYFKKLLLSNPCKHPTIIMPQDVCFNDLKFIIEFVYKGEIDVSQAELQLFLL
ncbi:hypothetical protein KQX54_003684 [Cotesia glomerata]|uniref:BTB domain-containing protein n=1 Tax=Cotesia glomerata TaxID=32391 RepID=A0AAV7ILX5_COTGL|nr:hypothetical protein KQX54_003684 [Cotesia glomerata]